MPTLLSALICGLIERIIADLNQFISSLRKRIRATLKKKKKKEGSEFLFSINLTHVSYNSDTELRILTFSSFFFSEF